ncbi:fdhC [Symbiodinium sp. CCMP2456]|nr:fdhC [Symbiodinium sp. CCMP2456]
MGLEAAKIGTDLVGMGVKAQKDANTAFTNMGVKANTEVLKAETKANNFFNKVRDGFTTGFTSGLSR